MFLQKKNAWITTQCLIFRQHNSRRGIGTLEVVIIIAVLLSVALIFREALTSYATRLIESVFGSQSAIADLIVTEGTGE